MFCGDYVELLRQMPGSRDHYFVCMTRGHRFDQECLLEIFKKSHAYIGMMGSKKRSFLMKKDLVEAGFAPELVESLHAPIGLSIGAQTPAEIALSVMSEIVKVRSEHAKETALDEQVLEELTRLLRSYFGVYVGHAFKSLKILEDAEKVEIMFLK